MTVREALKELLKGTHYNECMEVQINVERGNGRKVYRETEGKKWWGYTDGTEIWKPIRIPWANGNYHDQSLRFSLEEHACDIGLTGWDFVNKQSRWVGFDFDSIVSHKQGLTRTELTELLEKLRDIPYVHIVTSTGGEGFHVYIYFEKPIPTVTRQEHIGLARCVLSLLSALVDFDFSSKVDCCGTILWVWSKRATVKSFQVIKPGRPMKEPKGWRDFIGRTKKSVRIPRALESATHLFSRIKRARLNDEHRRVIHFLDKANASWWWDEDLSLLVCHTFDLKECHVALGLRGIFETNATGKDRPDHNCFCFPLPDGSWSVYRYHRGIAEHVFWEQDGKDWTHANYNIYPTLDLVSRLYGGLESEKGEFVFKKGEDAQIALRLMEVDLGIPVWAIQRECRIKPKKDNKIAIKFPAESSDSELKDWLRSVRGKTWERVLLLPKDYETITITPPDEILRHLTLSGSDAGWYLQSKSGIWNSEPRSVLPFVLLSLGYNRIEIEKIIGQATLDPWLFVSYPLEPEYPGNRCWNKNAPQLSVTPVEGIHPYWDLVLKHVGEGLNSAIISNDWCAEYNLLLGYDYILYWIAALFQEPFEPLPYLFLYGDQDTGKSTLHEALSLLLLNKKGYVRADNALTSTSRFNGELLGALLCIVEETDLSKSNQAYARIKDWVTGKTLSIRALYRDPIDVPNTTHWIQCANDIDACPIFPNDTRITMSRIEMPEEPIPKTELFANLINEIPAFLHTILHLEIPPSDGRLRIPVLVTEEKEVQQIANTDVLTAFLEDCCHCVDGVAMPYSDFYSEFIKYCPTEERKQWPPQKVSRKLPIKYPRGKMGGDGQMFIGNISFDKSAEPSGTLIRAKNRLVRIGK